MPFASSDVAEFKRLDELIRQKQHVDKEYNDLQGQLEVLDSRLAGEKAKFAEYEKKNRFNKKKPSSPSTFKKLIGKGKEVAAPSEADVMQQTITDLEKRIEELETRAAILSPGYEEYRTLCAQEVGHLDKVFSQHDAGPEERELAQKVTSMKPEFDFINERQKNLKRAAKMMKEAHRLCEASLRRLDQAICMGQGDMFMSLMPGNEGFDMMLSMEKRKHVTAASTGMANCSKVTDKARALVPEIQPIDPSVIQALNRWIDILAGSFLVDMVVQQQLDESYGRVQATAQHLAMGKQWVEDREREANARYEQIAPPYKATRKQLYGLRRTLLTSA